MSQAFQPIPDIMAKQRTPMACIVWDESESRFATRFIKLILAFFSFPRTLDFDLLLCLLSNMAGADAVDAVDEADDDAWLRLREEFPPLDVIFGKR